MGSWYLIFIIYMGAPTSQSSTPFDSYEQCVAAGEKIASQVQAYVGSRYSAICVESSTATKSQGE